MSSSVTPLVFVRVFIPVCYLYMRSFFIVYPLGAFSPLLALLYLTGFGTTLRLRVLIFSLNFISYSLYPSFERAHLS